MAATVYDRDNCAGEQGMAFRVMSLKKGYTISPIVYHLQDVSGKSGQKVNGRRPFHVAPAENLRELRNMSMLKSGNS